MIDIILVQTPPWSTHSPPIGLAALASFLKIKNIDVKAIDLNIILYNLSEDKGFWDFDRKDSWSDSQLFSKIIKSLDSNIDLCVSKILRDDPSIVGISTNQNSMLFSVELARRIKKASRVLVVAGGWGCYNSHERKILKDSQFFDAYVLGEGEETLFELISNFKSSKDFVGLNGIMCDSKDDKEFLPRSPVKDLSSLPAPDYESFNLQEYADSKLCVITTRGCVGRCTTWQ